MVESSLPLDFWPIAQSLLAIGIILSSWSHILWIVCQLHLLALSRPLRNYLIFFMRPIFLSKHWVPLLLFLFSALSFFLQISSISLNSLCPSPTPSSSESTTSEDHLPSFNPMDTIHVSISAPVVIVQLTHQHSMQICSQHNIFMPKQFTIHFLGPYILQLGIQRNLHVSLKLKSILSGDMPWMLNSQHLWKMVREPWFPWLIKWTLLAVIGFISWNVEHMVLLSTI